MQPFAERLPTGAFAQKGQKQTTHYELPTVLKGYHVVIQNLIFATKHLSSNEAQKLLPWHKNFVLFS